MAAVNWPASCVGTEQRSAHPAAASAGEQALLVLVHLRKGETIAQLAAGFDIGTATARRYVRETIALLSRRSPTLDQALRTARRDRYPFSVLDGTPIPIDRVAADKPCYSGKHKNTA